MKNECAKILYVANIFVWFCENICTCFAASKNISFLLSFTECSGTSKSTYVAIAMNFDKNFKEKKVRKEFYKIAWWEWCRWHSWAHHCNQISHFFYFRIFPYQTFYSYMNLPSNRIETIISISKSLNTFQIRIAIKKNDEMEYICAFDFASHNTCITFILQWEWVSSSSSLFRQAIITS